PAPCGCRSAEPPARRRRDACHVREVQTVAWVRVTAGVMALSATAAPRRAQAERRAETRGRLLDATLECLAELGYAGTTATEVVRRAGLSRGAQVHHFPTKAELVVAAVEHLFQRRHEEFRQAFADLP